MPAQSHVYNAFNADSGSFFRPPPPAQVVEKMLPVPKQVIFLKTLQHEIESSSDYHINWKSICTTLQRDHNILLTEEDARSIWYGLAYGSTKCSDDSSDELLFQTEGQPFVLEKTLRERNHRNKSRLFLVDYPHTLSQDCDIFRMQRCCPFSVLSPTDYSQKYVSQEEVDPDRSVTEGQSKLRCVIQMICKIFSLTEDEVRSSWGKHRLEQLEAVLRDIDITSDEYRQLFSQFDSQN